MKAACSGVFLIMFMCITHLLIPHDDLYTRIYLWFYNTDLEHKYISNGETIHDAMCSSQTKPRQELRSDGLKWYDSLGPNWLIPYQEWVTDGQLKDVISIFILVHYAETITYKSVFMDGNASLYHDLQVDSYTLD